MLPLTVFSSPGSGCNNNERTLYRPPAARSTGRLLWHRAPRSQDLKRRLYHIAHGPLPVSCRYLSRTSSNIFYGSSKALINYQYDRTKNIGNLVREPITSTKSAAGDGRPTKRKRNGQGRRSTHSSSPLRLFHPQGSEWSVYSSRSTAAKNGATRPPGFLRALRL